MLPIITAFTEGHRLTTKDGVELTKPDFSTLGHDLIHIAKSKEKIPLEAEDWINGGPWWVRGKYHEGGAAMVIMADRDCIRVDLMSGPENIRHDNVKARDFERRNATSDWMPCWKEKE